MFLDKKGDDHKTRGLCPRGRIPPRASVAALAATRRSPYVKAQMAIAHVVLAFLCVCKMTSATPAGLQGPPTERSTLAAHVGTRGRRTECKDNLEFRDVHDFECKDWVGYDCSKYTSEEYPKYKEEAALAAIREACPKSCKLCSTCTVDDTTKMDTCMAEKPTPDPTDKAAMCKYMKDVSGCQPACFCESMSQAEMTIAMAQVKSLGGDGCNPTCGSAAGLRASAFTAFVAGAVALVVAR